MIDEHKITQLFFQNPSFGYYLIQLVIKRFILNYIRAQGLDKNNKEIDR